MLGCRSFCASSTSVRKNLRISVACSGSVDLSTENSLTATSRAVAGSRARYTLLVVPLPSRRVSSYLPTLVPTNGARLVSAIGADSASIGVLEVRGGGQQEPSHVNLTAFLKRVRPHSTLPN